MSVKPEAERRQYFRVQDHILLACRPMEATELASWATHPPADPMTAWFELGSRFRAEGRQLRRALQRTGEDRGELGRQLIALDQRLCDLTGLLLRSQWQDDGYQQTHAVSLSAGGLAFTSERGYHAGQLLELQMMLPPDWIGVRAAARVVSCDSAGSAPGAWRIALEYVALAERDREQLVRHTLGRQSAQLRQRREATDPPPAD